MAVTSSDNSLKLRLRCSPDTAIFRVTLDSYFTKESAVLLLMPKFFRDGKQTNVSVHCNVPSINISFFSAPDPSSQPCAKPSVPAVLPPGAARGKAGVRWVRAIPDSRQLPTRHQG